MWETDEKYEKSHKERSDFKENKNEIHNESKGDSEYFKDFDDISTQINTSIEWKYSVSLWMKGVIHFEKYQKIRVMELFKRKFLAKNSIYSAFEKYGRLLRGFKRFRRRIILRRSKRFRKNKLLTTTFHAWVHVHSKSPIVPASRGCFVAACFKWIAFTFETTEPRYFLQWAKHSQLLVSQARSFVFGQLQLPQKRIPLFLHAVGIHDAYRIRSSFASWVMFISKLSLFKRKISLRLIYVTFLSWKHLVQELKRLRFQANRLNQRYCSKTLQYFFHQWKIIFKSDHLYSKYYHQLSQRFFVSLRNCGLRNRLQLELLDQAGKFHHSFNLLRPFRYLRYITALSKYHKQRVDAVGICLQRYYLSRCLQQWRKTFCSDWKLKFRHYFLHHLLSTNLGSVTHVTVFSKEFRIPVVALWYHKQKQFYLLTSRVRSYLSVWKSRLRHKHSLITQSQQVKSKSKNILLQQTFGIWLMKCLDQMNIKRTANLIIINHFRHLLKRNFESWKSCYRSIVDAKMLAIKYQHERHVDLQNRLVIWKEAMKEFHKKNYFKLWKKYLQRRKCGMKLKILIQSILFWNFQRVAWSRWKMYTDLSIIATCVQKYWRGYFSRQILNRNEYLYLKWLKRGNYLICARNIREKNLLRSIFTSWVRFLSSENRNILRNTIRVLLKRSFRKFTKYSKDSKGSRQYLLLGYRVYERNACLSFLDNLRSRSYFSLLPRKIDSYLRKKRLNHAFVILGLNLRVLLRNPKYQSNGRFVRLPRYHRDVLSLAHMKNYHMARGFRKIYLCAKSSRLASRYLLIANRHCKLKSSVKLAFRQWARRAHRWAKTTTHPIYLAHKSYCHRLLAAGWKTFMHSYQSFLILQRKQIALQRVVQNKYRRKRMLISLRRWYRQIIVKNSNVRRVELSIIRPLFVHWYFVFKVTSSNNFKIKRMHIKIMRRVVTTILLQWRLYSVRAKRYRELYTYQSNLTKLGILKHSWEKWIQGKVNNKYYYLSCVVFKKSELFLKLRYLKAWRRCYLHELVYQKQLVRAVFSAWVKVSKDCRIEQRSLQKSLAHYYLFSGRWALRLWRWKSRRRMSIRAKENYATRQMLRLKVKRMIQYWAKKCYWIGRKVLCGKTRGSKFLQSSVLPFTPHARKRQQKFDPRSTGINEMNQTYQTPMKLSHLEFSPTRAQTIRSRDASPSYSSTPRTLFGSQWKSSQSYQQNMNSSHFFRRNVPLDYEASQRWALRRWKNNVSRRIQSRLILWIHRTFYSWKRYYFECKHRKLAAIQRFQLFSNIYLLKQIFSAWRETLQETIKYRQLTLLSQSNRLNFVWNHWKDLIRKNYLRKRQHFSILTMLNSTDQRSKKIHLHRAYQFWKIKYRLSGPQTKLNSKRLLLESLINWKKLSAAKKLNSHWLCLKSLRRWKAKVQHLRQTREYVAITQKFVTLILIKLKRRCSEWLREAFDHWYECSHEDLRSSPSAIIDWKSEINIARSSTLSLASRRSIPISSMESLPHHPSSKNLETSALKHVQFVETTRRPPNPTSSSSSSLSYNFNSKNRSPIRK